MLNFALVLIRIWIFSVKKYIILPYKSQGKKSSTGARDFKFSQQANNMFYIILKYKKYFGHFSPGWSP